MLTTTPHRRLIIPLDDHELTVAVEDDLAVLDLVARRASLAEPAQPGEPPVDGPPVRLRVPARALVAALRVAWADVHDERCFEPWRRTTREGRWHGYEPDEPYDGWWDDVGDSDPEGYTDPTVVPFRMPKPLPARSGAAWEEHEHETVREMWLAAEPDTDKQELIRAIATRLDRGVGGISARLRLAGCDPTCPGSRWDGKWGDDDDTVQRGAEATVGSTR